MTDPQREDSRSLSILPCKQLIISDEILTSDKKCTYSTYGKRLLIDALMDETNHHVRPTVRNHVIPGADRQART